MKIQFFMLTFLTAIFFGVKVRSDDAVWAAGVGTNAFNASVMRTSASMSLPETDRHVVLSKAASPAMMSLKTDGGFSNASTIIEELAYALGYNPTNIYEFVRNQIDSDLYAGHRRSPERVLQDRTGNDCDQASLLIALLRASGFDANYRVGAVNIPVFGNNGHNLSTFLGVTNSYDAFELMGEHLLPVYPPDANGWVVNEYYTWVVMTNDSIEVEMDPFIKPYKHSEGIDAVEWTSYARSNLYTVAGGIISSSGISGLDGAEVDEYLAEMTTELCNEFVQRLPTGSVSDLLGSKQIIEGSGIGSLCFSPYYFFDFSSSADFLGSSDLGIVVDGDWQTITYSDLGTRTVSVKIGTNGTGQVLLNGTVWKEGAVGTYDDGENVIPVSSSVIRYVYYGYPDNRYGWEFLYEDQNYSLKPGATYAFPIHLNPYGNQAAVDACADDLAQVLAGVVSGDPELLSLQKIGAQYFHERGIFRQLADNRHGKVIHSDFGSGAFCQKTSGVLCDIRHSSAVSYPNDFTDREVAARGWARGLVDSALEHGVWEQNQPGSLAVSSVRGIAEQCRGTGTLFRVTNSNYTQIEPMLSGYSTNQLAGFQSILSDTNRFLILPDRRVDIGSWTGATYLSVSSSGHVASIVDDTNGGVLVSPSRIGPTIVNEQNLANTKVASNIQTPKGADPVDMASGSYLFNTVDLSIDGPLPLVLKRNYSSRSSASAGTLGFGWNHSFNISAQKHSAPGKLLGRSLEDMAGSIVGYHILLDVLENDDTAQSWAIADLVAEWMVDRLAQTAVTVYTGQEATTFIQQPDGTFTPPEGMTFSLVETNGVYVMQQRHGNTYTFNTNGLIDIITDPSGNTLDFAYNADVNLYSVTSSFGPALTFGYTNFLLNTVSDSTGRTVEYQYDSMLNLTNVTDAAGFDWSIGYDHAHRIKWVKDPEKITTIQNNYNSAGQVTNQISATGHAYKTLFAGNYSIEEDPYGNQTTYYFDSKGRAWSVEKADGTRTCAFYNGQNHITNAVNEAGVTNVFVFDKNNNLLAQTNALGTSEQVATHYGYDSENHLRFVTNAVGTADQTVTEMTYTATHKLDTITAAVGTADEVTTDFDYYSNGLLQQLSEGNGLRVTEYTYDAFGHPDTVASTDAGTVDFDYNPRGELVDRKDAKNQRTQFTYNNLGRLLVTEFDDGSTVSNSYYANGLLRTTTDQRNNTTAFYWTPAYEKAGVVFADGSSISNRYDEADRLVATRDAEGYWTTSQLDAIGQITNQIFAIGSQQFSYDFAGNLLEFTDAEGHTTQYAYDAMNRKTRIEFPDGSVRTFAYSQQGLLSAATNQPGTALEQVTSQTHDALGRILQSTDALGNTTEFEYNALGFQTLERDARGNETRTGYNAQGQPVAITNALNQVTRMTYDLNGNLETITDPLNHVTEHSYNELNQRVRTDFPDGSFVTSTFDSSGNLLSKTDANGVTTTFGYNEMNRLVSSTSTVDSVFAGSSYTYNNNGNILTKTDPEGNSSTFQYDALGRQISAESSTSLVTNQFDSAGNLTSTSQDPNNLNLWSSSAYDSRNRLISQQSAIGTQQFSYDPLGRATNRIDALSKPWKTEYDPNNQPTAQIRPSGAREETRFDAMGRRTRFINAEGKAVNFGFDALGRLTAITNAIGDVTQYGFDAAGNIAWRRNAADELTNYDYDEMNRLVTVMHESVEVASYDHDSNGNVTFSGNANVTVSCGYNELNLMTSSTQTVGSVGFVVGNTFDLNGFRTGITYPGGLTVTYNYGADNRLDGITTSYSGNNKTTTFGYDGASRLTGIAYPNGINTTFGYDAESRVTNIVHGTFVDRKIERNALGFKTTECINAGIKPTVPNTFRSLKTHNAADQLTSERIQTATTNWTTIDYEYNDNGGLETVSRASSPAVSYAYDYDNRLQSVDDAPSFVENLYDASGARIGRIAVDGVGDPVISTNYFVIDYVDGLKRPLAETDASGGILRYYVWSGSRLLCHIDTVAGGGDPGGSIYYYHSDELGSTLALTDESGNVTDQFAYMPYGYATHTGSTETPFQWLGGYGVYYDADTDLHLTLHRAYSPKMKRFISPDPLGIDGGANVYMWANMNPLFFVDPYGLCAESFWSKVGDHAVDSLWAAISAHPMFMPMAQTVSTIKEYAANYQYSGSWYHAGNMTFNPVTRAGMFWYENATGNGIHYYNYGDHLSYGQQVMSGLKGTVEVVSLIAIAEGGARMTIKLTAPNRLLRSSNASMGFEGASDDLMRAIGSRRDLRTGNDIVRLLDSQGAEAAMFDGTDLILHRPNPSRAAMLEEFLHGTQSRLGLTGRAGFNAESHVKDFMIRHQNMLGLGAEDVSRLQQLMDAGL